MNFKNLFENIANKIFSDRENEEGGALTNQMIVDKVEKAFVSVLKRQSVDDQMLYDCNFMITIPTEHYDSVSLAAPVIAKTIVKRFYKVIKENLKKRPNYTPISEYWNFEFVPKELTGDIESSGIEIMSQLTTEKSWGTTLSDKDSIGTTSLNGKHSRYQRWNINPNILKNIDILERGKVRIPFNNDLEFVESNMQSQQTDRSTASAKPSNESMEDLAKLYFEESGMGMEFPMRREQIMVGRNTSNTDKSSYEKLFIRTQDSSLSREHFYIHYEQKEGRFYIAVFAHTVVNGELLKTSSSKERPNWVALKQHSHIECGSCKIEFKALK